MGAFVMGVFRLGEQLFGWAVGLLAALIVVTREPYLNYGIRGYVDLLMVALVVWAAVLEARRRRRGWPVLVLLGLAGLLRPEAWLYAAAYWLWLFPARTWRERVGLALLVAAAPLAWAFSDLAISGDFLWSLHGTHDLATQLHRETGLANGLKLAPRRVGEILRLPELLLAVAGFVLGLMWLRRRIVLPTAVALLNGLAFCVLAAAGLSLLARYVFLAGAMVALFSALACFGWTNLPPDHPARRAWKVLGVLAVVALALIFAVRQRGAVSDLRSDIRARATVHYGLRDLPLPKCRPVYVSDRGMVPLVAYWDHLRPGSVLVRTPPDSAGVRAEPAGAEAQRLSLLNPNAPPTQSLRPPPGWRKAASTASWVAYTGPRCSK
jgi:hypothetical protein